MSTYSFIECPDSYMGQSIPVDHLIAAGRTEFQSFELFENHGLGKVLVLDGVVQLSERGEFVYSEAMAHIPLFGHGEVEDVLIIGGGDGAVLEEVLKHRGVKSVTLVDLDGEVMDLCRQHFGAIHNNAFDDPRVTVHVADGIDYVRTCNRTFDAILVDGPDPVGPGTAADPLFTQEFFGLCRLRLTESGVFVIGNDMPYRNPEACADTVAKLKQFYKDAGLFLAAVPDYQGGPLCWAWASDEPIDVPFEGAHILGLRYWNEDVHHGSFQLPNYVRELVR